MTYATRSSCRLGLRRAEFSPAFNSTNSVSNDPGIHAEVCHKGFNAELNSFVQSYGDKELDASLLLLPLVGFLPADDARIQGTVSAIEQHLLKDGFVLRYDTATSVDGLVGEEGVFLACSFWLADNYILQGRDEDARTLFERLLALRTDLGLLAGNCSTHPFTCKRLINNAF